MNRNDSGFSMGPEESNNPKEQWGEATELHPRARDVVAVIIFIACVVFLSAVIFRLL